MKIIYNTTIYKCDYCKKTYQSKYFCEKHELVCSKNPDNIPACYGCVNLVKSKQKLNTETLVLGENFGVSYGEEMREYNLLKCIKFDRLMVPIVSHKKGYGLKNILDDADFFVMPQKCPSFSDEFRIDDIF